MYKLFLLFFLVLPVTAFAYDLLFIDEQIMYGDEIIIPEESKLVLQSKDKLLYGEYVRKNGEVAIFKLREKISKGPVSMMKTYTCDIHRRYDSSIDAPLFKYIYPIQYSKNIMFNKSDALRRFFMVETPSVVTNDYRDRYCAFEHTGQYLGIDKVYDKERYIFSLEKEPAYKKYYKNIKPARYFLEIAVPVSNSHYAIARWFFGKWSIEDYNKIIETYDKMVNQYN